MQFIVSCTLLVSVSILTEKVFSLSSDLCKSYDAAKLYTDATEIVNEVDSLLPTYRTASGVLVTIVDEDDGDDAGGGTNTDGSYQTFIFNGSEVFPDGICDIPTNDGNTRCDTQNGGSTITFLLGPVDVIAFVACSPPEMRYFSYDTIISTRLTEEYPFYPGQPFGDTISHMSINTSEIGNVYDQPILVILSADYKAAQTVADAYISTKKISASSVSIHGIDANTVRLWDRSGGQTWQDTSPDILSMVSRMAVPLQSTSNKDQSSPYDLYKLIPWPVKIYYASDDEKAQSPVTSPVLISRQTVSSMNEKLTLSDDYNILQKNIIDNVLVSYENSMLSGIQTVNLTAEGYYDDWTVVLDRKNNDSFAVPTRDATYGLPLCTSDGACALKDTTLAVLIGVLHRDTMQTSYNSAGVSVMNIYTGKYLETHWLLDDDIRGSATRYFNSNTTTSTADLFFAIDFMPPGRCLNSMYPQWCVEFQATSYKRIGLAPYLILGERIYALNETKIGPDASQTIGVELLVFSI